MPAFNSTLGNTAATSYISTAEADTYWQNTFNEALWTALSEGEKQTALMAATEALETLTYAGDRCDPSTDDEDLPQRLQWPREKFTCKGVTAECDSLPKEIVNATSWLALQLHTNQPTPSAPSGNPIGSIKSQKLGDLQQDFYDVKEGSSTKVDASAPLILQQYPELVDMLSCWSATSTGAGKVILRVRS